MSEQTAHSEEEVTILVGAMTREEFLGEPDLIEFPQSLRPSQRPSSKSPVEKSEDE